MYIKRPRFWIHS